MRKFITATTFVICLFAAWGIAAAEALRPITHEDVWLMQRLGSPVVSPDGNTLVFNAMGHLYFMTLPDGKPQRMTTNDAFEFAPTFSPDGSRVAFTTWSDDENVRWKVELEGAGGREWLRDVAAVAAGCTPLVQEDRVSECGGFVGVGQALTADEAAYCDAELLRYLGGLDLYPGAELSVSAMAPFNGPLTIRVGDSERVLGRELATRLQVTYLHESEGE